MTFGMQIMIKCLGIGIYWHLGYYTFLSCLGAFPIVITYPLAKRWTNYPQAHLGVAFNYGVVIAFVAARNSIDLGIVLPLYLACFSWTMIYDTIYAHQDKKFDKQIGIKSTALTWGENSKEVFKYFNVIQYASLGVTGYMAGLNMLYYLPGLTAAQIYFMNITFNTNINNEKECWDSFSNNKWYAVFVWLAILAGKFTANKENEEKLEN